jgi:type III secretion protein V
MKESDIKNTVNRLSRHNDIVLAGLVVAIIALIILPIPPPIVDSMIVLNMCVSVGLLMLSLYIPSALSLSTFPTLLLFTTLFRLALNITTTRQILLHANAGKIIYTFGNLVVGGNFVVGGVVFIIITIVQFVVIAKGSERVAEVAARFTLDAMPGKQMSIDADMRAGVIDLNEARTRRARIESESKMFGAMDGAMKFVKGDAIAGLIIAVINILGGIAIGSFQRGMAVGEAVQKYSILTIGDGLVSQIPALFISVTAGIIITRVEASDETGHLAGEIGTQVLNQPKALLITGGILLGMALIPGFPKVQFLALGIGLAIFGGAFFLFAPKIEKHIPADKKHFTILKQGDDKDLANFSITVPLLVDVSEHERPVLRVGRLNEQFTQIGKSFYYKYGVPFPGVSFRFNDRLPAETYYILVNEVPMYQGQILRNKLLARAPTFQLKKKSIPFKIESRFLPDMRTVWVDADDKDKLDEADIACLDAMQIICHHLTKILDKHVVDFCGLDETKFLLDQMETHYEDLIKEVYQTVSIHTVAQILENLLREEIPIRNLKTIMESIVEWGQKEEDVSQLTEYVRADMKHWICYKYADSGQVINALLLEPELENIIRQNMRRTPSGVFIELPPDLKKGFQQYVKAKHARATKNLVVITSDDIRRHVRALIETEAPNLPVMSYKELIASAKIRTVERIGLNSITEPPGPRKAAPKPKSLKVVKNV